MKCPVCNCEMESGSIESTHITRPKELFYISNEDKNKKGFLNTLKAKLYSLDLGIGAGAEAYRCENCGKIFTAFDYK